MRPLLRIFRRRRVALVVGVADYEHMSPLELCENDALGIAESLDFMGYEIFLVINPTDQELHASVADFLGRANGADVALLYFSGHGLEVGQQNYLLGKDVDMSTVVSEAMPGVEFASIFTQLSQVSDQTIGILDTCRKKPPEVVPSPASSRRRKAAAEELAPEEAAPVPEGEPRTEKWSGALNGVADAIILYASDSGDPARQLPGAQHSYFTGALLDYLDIPGLSLPEIFARTRDAVIKQTGKDEKGQATAPQVPWSEASVSNRTFVLRKRSIVPIVGLFCLALIAFFVARNFQIWRPLHLVEEKGSALYLGLIFALLVGFAVWRWGGVNARPLLVAALTSLTWFAVEFLNVGAFAPRAALRTGNTEEGPAVWVVDGVTNAFGAISNWPDLLTATLVAMIVMIAIASEVRTLRNWLVFAPPFLVLFCGLLLSELEGRGLLPGEIRSFFGIKQSTVSEAYYDSGIWMIVFAAVLGVCFQRITYLKSNKARRVLHKVASPEVIWAAGLVGLVLGLLAGLSGHPLPDKAMASFASLPLKPPINWVPGLAFLLTMTFVMWRVHKQDYVQMGLSTFVLWVLVTWLPNMDRGQALALPAQVNLTISAVMLGGGAIAMASLLNKRMWRVPSWTLCLLASLLALLPFLVLRQLWESKVIPITPNADWALLYGVWLGSFAAAVSFGLSRPRPYDPRQKTDVPLPVLLKHAFVGTK